MRDLIHTWRGHLANIRAMMPIVALVLVTLLAQVLVQLSCWNFALVRAQSRAIVEAA